MHDRMQSISLFLHSILYLAVALQHTELPLTRACVMCLTHFVQELGWDHLNC